MTFALPPLLWLLLVPLALLLWELTRARRAADLSQPKILRAEADAHSLTLSPVAAPLSTPSPTRARACLCLGLALAVVALARPQWGRIDEPVFDQSREIILAVDLSRSMLTPDVKPSRLERAKLLIQSLLERLAGERLGLVVFSGRGGRSVGCRRRRRLRSGSGRRWLGGLAATRTTLATTTAGERHGDGHAEQD